MKKAFLLALAFVALFSCLEAQPILVGLYSNQNTYRSSVVRWNAGTGTMLDSVETTQYGSLMGSSAFDAMRQTYYFESVSEICRIGFNPATFTEISTISAISGTEIDMANGNIYSVRPLLIYDSVGTYIGSNIEFVYYNIADSTETVMGVLPTITSYYMDVNCYDSNTGTYYFVGLDSLNASILVSIPTRATSFNPMLTPLSSIDPGNVFTLEFDNNDNRLYGLSSSGAPDPHLQILEIDPLTGAWIVKADLPQLVSYYMTTTTYDQASSSMIMLAIDSSQNTVLCNFAMPSLVLSTLLYPFVAELYELECDNSQFAGVKYGQVTASEPSRSTVEVSVYPNPTRDVLHIASAHSISELSLIDAMGKTLPLGITWKDGEIDLRHLAPGYYTLRAKGSDGNWMQTKFLKQ